MFRLITVLFLVLRHGARTRVAAVRRRGSWMAQLRCSTASLLETLGGAFPKVGQILSTRADVVGEELRASLGVLQDRVAPMPGPTALGVLTRAGLLNRVERFEPTPVASATIAQVHRAYRRDDGRPVALKVRRPGVRRNLATDCRLLQCFGRIIARLPRMTSVPVNQALAEAGEVLLGHTDFRREAANHRRLQSLFAESRSVIVPRLHDDRCTDEVLVMDFVEDMRKLDDPACPDATAREALTIGVRALYRMIFEAGLIHCDLHPGNVLLGPEGRLVVLDAGFLVVLTDPTRRAFAEFFLAIAFRDGGAAARIARETALRLPSGLDVGAFDTDVAALIERVGGLRARDFQVASFVGDLFAIMRRHGVLGTSQFTLAILSLLVFEGLAKQRFPDLDFQQEAIPFLVTARAS